VAGRYGVAMYDGTRVRYLCWSDGDAWTYPRDSPDLQGHVTRQRAGRAVPANVGMYTDNEGDLIGNPGVTFAVATEVFDKKGIPHQD
jgi:hypothetical protein